MLLVSFPTVSAVKFPAPLALPGDELALDSRCPPQSFRNWLREHDRNETTPGRNTLYVVWPPRIKADAAHVQEWGSPHVLMAKNKRKSSKKDASRERETELPAQRTEDVLT